MTSIAAEDYLRRWKFEMKIEVPKLGRFDFDERNSKSWHVPTPELLKLLKKYSPLVSVFSGLAFTEFAACRIEDANIICTDKQPAPNPWCCGTPLMSVRKMVAHRAIRNNPNRNVFMAWPPYGHSSAAIAARAIKPGRFLIYIGEDSYGCNANHSFFKLLQTKFTYVETLAIPQFSGIHDECNVYERND